MLSPALDESLFGELYESPADGPRPLMAVEEKEGYLVPVPRVVTVAELAKALNAIGATPGDLIAIFNALKRAGALQAKLEIM